MELGLLQEQMLFGMRDKLYNTQGRIVLNGGFDEKTQINISNLSKGTYIVRINGSSNVRIVKN